MRRDRARLVWVILASLVLCNMVDRGFGQTRDADSSAEMASPSTDWHQKVLKQARPAVTRPESGTSSVVARIDDQPAQTRVEQTSYTQPQAPARRAVVFSEPKVVHRQRVVRTGGEEEIPPGEIQYAPLAQEGPFSGEVIGDTGGMSSGCASCGGEYGESGDCDTCGSCGPKEDAYGYECFDGCLRLGWLRDLTVSAGAHGFKGPRDRNENGNFGLHEGLQISGPLGDPWNIGYQVGVNFEQSNFSGTPITSRIKAADRKQCFVTASMFRRAECNGFQWAVAYDFLNDNYDEKVDLQQIRSETSFLFDNICEIGYFGVYGVSSKRLQDRVILEPTDMFALFARRYFENGGDGRIWGGATSYGDGLLGAELWIPLGKSFALENAVTYVLPKEGSTVAGQAREAWGLSATLVWYPGRTATCQQHNPYRPMLRTADNTMFMINRDAK